jgi:hypothetical protein
VAAGSRYLYPGGTGWGRAVGTRLVKVNESLALTYPQSLLQGPDARPRYLIPADAASLDFTATADSAQGAQTVDAAASLDFTAAAVSAQGTQTVDAAELEQFIAAVASGQGGQSAAVAAQLVFIAVAESAQGSQTVDASGFTGVLLFGDVTTAQGGQTADAVGDVAAPRDQSSGGRIARTLGVRLDRRNVDLPGEQRVYGEAASAQGSQTADGVGEVRAPQQVDGRAESAQVLAEVIAIGAVDNRRPRNQQKKKYAAALLAA